MPRPTSKKLAGLGKAIVKDRFRGQRRMGIDERGLHSTDLDDGPSWVKMRSVTDEGDLDAFLNTAELAGTEFTAEKLNIKVVSNENQNLFLPTKQEEEETLRKHDEFKDKITVPRRPPWDDKTTAEQLQRRERDQFLEWRRDLALLSEEKGLLMTPFERNLEVWRQLWRVIERSHLVVQIVDARNPLMFRSTDLEKYVKEVDTGKNNLLLINKADMLTKKQRCAWADYFDREGIHYTFFSAALSKQAQEEREQRLEKQEIKQAMEQGEHSSEGTAEEEGDSEMDDEIADHIKNTHLSEHHQSAPEPDEATGNTSDNVSDKDAHENDRVVEAEAEEDTDDRTRILTASDLLERLISEAPSEHGEKLMIGLVGYPNVGKSSTINALIGEHKVSVSSTPGKTKHFQTIHLTSSIVLCDCPGLVFPSFATSKADMVCNGVLPIDQLREYTGPVALVAQRIPKEVVETIYGIKIPIRALDEGGSGIPTAEELLIAYALARGFTKSSQGNPDESRAARYVLKDYVNGKLLYCHPPPGLSGREFNEENNDLEQYLRRNKKAAPASRVPANAINYVAPVAAADGPPTGQKTRSLDSNFFNSTHAAPKIVGKHAPAQGAGFSRVKLYPHQNLLTDDGRNINPGGRKQRLAMVQANVANSGLAEGKKHKKGKKHVKLRSGAGLDVQRAMPVQWEGDEAVRLAVNHALPSQKRIGGIMEDIVGKVVQIVIRSRVGSTDAGVQAADNVRLYAKSGRSNGAYYVNTFVRHGGCNILLERWRITLDQCSEAKMPTKSSKGARRPTDTTLILLIQSIYSTTRLLPIHSFLKRKYRSSTDSSGRLDMDIRCSVTSADGDIAFASTRQLETVGDCGFSSERLSERLEFATNAMLDVHKFKQAYVKELRSDVVVDVTYAKNILQCIGDEEKTRLPNTVSDTREPKDVANVAQKRERDLQEAMQLLDQMSTVERDDDVSDSGPGEIFGGSNSNSSIIYQPRPIPLASHAIISQSHAMSNAQSTAPHASNIISQSRHSISTISSITSTSSHLYTSPSSYTSKSESESRRPSRRGAGSPFPSAPDAERIASMSDMRLLASTMSRVQSSPVISNQFNCDSSFYPEDRNPTVSASSVSNLSNLFAIGAHPLDAREARQRLSADLSAYPIPRPQESTIESEMPGAISPPVSSSFLMQEATHNHAPSRSIHHRPQRPILTNRRLSRLSMSAMEQERRDSKAGPNVMELYDRKCATYSRSPSQPSCIHPYSEIEMSSTHQAHELTYSRQDIPSEAWNTFDALANSGANSMPSTPRRQSLNAGASAELFGSLVGSYEESILHGRMSTLPSKPISFIAQIGVLGQGTECKPSLKCPPHVVVPFQAYFYEFTDDDYPSPYVGNVDLETNLTGERYRTMPGGYRLPPKGQLQILIKNQDRTAVKLFLLPYDLRDMLVGTKTFMRQKTYIGEASVSDEPLRADKSTANPSNGALRYAIHMQVCCPSPGKIYLYKTIKVVFANRTPDKQEHLTVVCDGPGASGYTKMAERELKDCRSLSKSKREERISDDEVNDRLKPKGSGVKSLV